ncbi:stage II sporulation protein P [Thermosyntropha lipolytica DSM 11003]|uniref:Stage II sporulation protein P n=1 Tax=Thermosyntropha lipolytica DSM 11003 TaxID=1123382 RepID=A0A1M5PFT0_9FIRM|nr:stage II sporulation protein P [Thermosyntropha lipolytica]SHH00577.1 stage II sporulation protein P [Thermosyntropha lipolytica DSM 11003]
MDRRKKYYLAGFFGILFVILITAYFLNLNHNKNLPFPPFASSADYYTIRDTAGNIILQTGIKVYQDDEYINEKNIHYIVTSVKGKEAVAVVKNQASSHDITSVPTASLFLPDKLLKPDFTDISVAIYHTHSDESYIPTSGTASKKGNGDIFKVGKALKERLEIPGIKVYHSLNAHDPHDINAYHRSRRTAIDLVKKGPDALLDIHRDSAPLSAYQTNIKDTQAARVMIVIGRSNPNMQVNLDYARRVKAAADKIYPGFMRGIFIGKGDYNQDLYPTALLLEVGTEQNSLEEAKASMNFLGDILIHVLRNEDRS